MLPPSDLTTKIEALQRQRWPTAIRNIKMRALGVPVSMTVECRLFTDSDITGAPHLAGPYQFINTVAHAAYESRTSLRPAIMLRVADHFPQDVQTGPPQQLGDDAYHGGTIFDEIAALCSLAWGARIAAGPVEREFHEGGDPLGTPVAYWGYAAPQSVAHVPRMIPRFGSSCSISDLTIFQNLSSLSESDSIALVKSARLYQRAAWISETDPNLCWLLLVSAVETAAGQNHQVKFSKLDKVKEDFPEFIRLIEDKGYTDLLDATIDLLSRYAGATKKFLNFFSDYAPDPPQDRPVEWLRLSYERDDLKKSLKTIYNCRSRALHSGTPFPGPVCQPPYRIQAADQPLPEIPIGEGAYAQNASWEKSDMPMLLHTFEHIARDSLLKWWRQLPLQS